MERIPITAAWVRDISPGKRLAMLSRPVMVGEWDCDAEKCVLKGVLYIVSSIATVPYSGEETYLFRANSDGEILAWGELEGSFRGGHDHQKALDEFVRIANEREIERAEESATSAN